jgi:hypothetical protein
VEHEAEHRTCLDRRPVAARTAERETGGTAARNAALRRTVAYVRGDEHASCWRETWHTARCVRCKPEAERGAGGTIAGCTDR